MNFFKHLYFILLDQRGDTLGAEGGDEGQGAAPVEGQGETPDGEKPEAEAGQGDEPPAEGKYGRFGDKPDVDALFQAFQELETGHKSLTAKTTQTEKSLSALRRAAEGSGFRVMTDSQGNAQLVPIKRDNETPQQEKKRRFTEEHLAKLGGFFSGENPQKTAKEFLDILTLHLQDNQDEALTQYDKKLLARGSFQRVRDESNSRMLKLYPHLDEEGETFNKEFFDRATEIYHENYEMHPRGELIAAGEAAAELGISPITLKKAEAKGFEKGKETKTVLAPVGQGSKGRFSKGGIKELSKDDYLKLTPEKRAEYDKVQLQIK